MQNKPNDIAVLRHNARQARDYEELVRIDPTSSDAEKNAAKELRKEAEVSLLNATTHYLFPRPSLLDKTDAQLHAYIAQFLPIAEGMTDGSDGNSEVKIDYAQDTVRQAQDILASRLEDKRLFHEFQNANPKIWPRTTEG